MSFFNHKLCITIISSYLFLTGQVIAGELEDLVELKKTAVQELTALKTTGIGAQHPQIVAKENLIIELEDRISISKQSHEEIVILLKGTTSVHMKGHPKYGKTEAALPSLLLQGWKIKNIVPTGDDKAYVWLARE